MTPQLKTKIKRTIQFLQKHEWTVGYLARDKEDIPVSLSSPKAHAFCAIGAFRKANPHVGSNSQMAFKRAFRQQHHSSIAGFNDFEAKSKRDVINALRKLL